MARSIRRSPDVPVASQTSACDDSRHVLPNRVHRSLVSTQVGPQTPEPRRTLFEHASALHRQTPDQPLARNGEPFPDEQVHRVAPRPKPPKDRERAGLDVADVLAGHFADAHAQPAELAWAFHGLYVSIHPNGHIDAVAESADRERVMETGRWLVRNGTDRCAVTVGLAVLGAVGIEAGDIPLVQTIGLLSECFGSLAARALERVDGGAQALIWLADRVAGWGRLYVVEALCRLREPTTYRWLLTRAVDGDFLNGYFVGKVAVTGGLHAAVAQFDTDPELVDAVGRLLYVMSGDEGMGMTLRRYPHCGVVLAAHSRAFAGLAPTSARIQAAAIVARYLGRRNPANVAASAAWDEARAAYLALLRREDWMAAAGAAMAGNDKRMLWIAENIAPELGLPWMRSLPGRVSRTSS